VVYYRAADRSEPVNDAIDALPVKAQVAIDNQIERLGLFGPALGFPYTSQIEGELRELRCHFGGDHYRVLYGRSRNLFVSSISWPSTPGGSPPQTSGSPRSAGTISRSG
jgi:phage-related protein